MRTNFIDDRRGVVFLLGVPHVDDAVAVRHPRRPALHIRDHIRGHDLGGQALALKGVGAVGGDDQDGPHPGVARRAVVGVKRDLSAVRRPHRPEVVIGPPGQGLECIARLQHILDQIDVVVLVASVDHHDLLAVRRPLRVEVGVAPPRQPRHGARRHVQEVDIPFAGPARHEHQLIGHRRPVCVAVLLLVVGEPHGLAVALAQVEIVVPGAAVGHEHQAVAGGGPRDPGVVADVLDDSGEKELRLPARLGQLEVDALNHRAVRAGDHDLLPLPAASLEGDQASRRRPDGVRIVATGLDRHQRAHIQRLDRRLRLLRQILDRLALGDRLGQAERGDDPGNDPHARGRIRATAPAQAEGLSPL